MYQRKVSCGSVHVSALFEFVTTPAREDKLEIVEVVLQVLGLKLAENTIIGNEVHICPRDPKFLYPDLQRRYLTSAVHEGRFRRREATRDDRRGLGENARLYDPRYLNT